MDKKHQVQDAEEYEKLKKQYLERQNKKQVDKDHFDYE